MSNQLWHPSGKYFCKKYLWLFYQWNVLEWNYYYFKNLEILLTYQHFHPQVRQKFRQPTLCQADHNYRVKGNGFFHLIFYACHVSSAASCSGPRPHVVGIESGVTATPNHQEKEENSILYCNILGLFHVKQKEAELSRFESFGFSMGTQLLLLESHSWN